MKKVGFLLIVVVSILVSHGCKKEEESVKVVADFSVLDQAPMINDPVQFENNSLNATYYEWYFGDHTVSHDENATHTYSAPGDFRVSLKANGSDGSDTVSSIVTVGVPDRLKTIYDGKGIEGLTLQSDNWHSMKDKYSMVDTAYFSYYNSKYDLYINQVYYYMEGFVGLYYCNTNKIQDTDKLQAIIIVLPYSGYTSKNIKLNNQMSMVKEFYGKPDEIFDDRDVYAFYYESLGIDFNAFYDEDKNVLHQIAVYPPEKKAASKKGASTSQIRAALHEVLQKPHRWNRPASR